LKEEDRSLGVTRLNSVRKRKRISTTSQKGEIGGIKSIHQSLERRVAAGLKISLRVGHCRILILDLYRLLSSGTSWRWHIWGKRFMTFRLRPKWTKERGQSGLAFHSGGIARITHTALTSNGAGKVKAFREELH